MPEDEVVDIEEVADLLGMSRRSILNAIRKQGLPARKVGIKYLFYKKAVLDWLAPGRSGDEVVSKEKYDELKDERDEIEDAFDELKKELDRFRSAVLCSVCGKPMYPSDNLVEKIKKAVGTWGHSSCIAKQKAEKQGKEE